MRIRGGPMCRKPPAAQRSSYPASGRNRPSRGAAHSRAWKGLRACRHGDRLAWFQTSVQGIEPVYSSLSSDFSAPGLSYLRLFEKSQAASALSRPGAGCGTGVPPHRLLRYPFSHRRAECAQTAPIGLGAADIQKNLRTKGRGVGELAFAPNAAVELDANAARSRFLERRKKVGLDGHRVAAVERGTRADVCDGGPGAVVIQILDFGDVNTMSEKKFRVGSQIQCGDGLARADALAADNLALQRIAMAKQAPRAGNLAAPEMATNHGARNHLAPITHMREELGLETVLGAEGGETLRGAGLFVAKTKVIADDDHARIERLDEHLADEVLRSEAGQGGVEWQHQNVTDAQARENRHAFFDRDQQRNRLAVADDGARVRVEGDDSGREAKLGGALDGRAHQLLMAKMDAIKAADGECRGTEVAARPGEVMEDAGHVPTGRAERPIGI